jgi:hypothetical protein
MSSPIRMTAWTFLDWRLTIDLSPEELRSRWPVVFGAAAKREPARVLEARESSAHFHAPSNVSSFVSPTFTSNSMSKVLVDGYIATCAVKCPAGTEKLRCAPLSMLSAPTDTPAKVSLMFP